MNLKSSTKQWKLSAAVKEAKATRGSSTATTSGLPAEFLRSDVEIVEVRRAESAPVQRGAAPPALDLDIESASDEFPLVAIRHPSGAITFHPSSSRESRRATRGSGGRGPSNINNRFVISLPASPLNLSGERESHAIATRGLLPKSLEVVLIKVKKLAVDELKKLAVSAVGTGLEMAWWKIAGRKEGLFHVSPSDSQLGLAPVRSGDLNAAAGEKSLLLIHGTFSHAEGAFRGLAESALFKDLKAKYGDRIFALNHFTVSRSPADNVRNFLKQLPNDTHEFDVITHSRGGLVLRHLTECPSQFGSEATKFQLGHAVLVAAPNAGTPLATPRRWEETVGYFATLLEWANKFCPGHPWLMGSQFIADGIVKLAAHLAGDLPGLASMDSDGEVIAALQDPPGPAASAYSALVANCHPQGNLLARLVDVGFDSFFGGANDLVVPTEGGWDVSNSNQTLIPPNRVGCFGEGGNLAADSGKDVHHLNFFSQSESLSFIRRALLGEPQPLGLLNLEQSLPSRRLLRAGRTVAVAKVLVKPERTLADVTVPARPIVPDLEVKFRRTIPSAYGDALSLTILDVRNDDDKTPAGKKAKSRKFILASYRGARVREPFETSNAESSAGTQPGRRFQHIIAFMERVRGWLEGSSNKQGEMFKAPTHEEVRQVGEDMFECLITGGIRRLYDAARADQGLRRLNVILTSEVDWLAQIPWEFAFDGYRHRYLATDEIHLTRNVMTTVPSERGLPRDDKLRILIVAAQPLGTVPLELAEEEELIRASFADLSDTGLVELKILPHATAESVLGEVQLSEYHQCPYDVVHFIGHGEYDRNDGEGSLVFEKPDGGVHKLGVRALREILCQRGIKLAYLNACESATADHGHQNRGLAQSLVSNGLPAVIANQFPVFDNSALTFAKHFYWSLARGQSLGEAAREARVLLNCQPDAGTIDWGVPVLFALDPEYRLCTSNKTSVQPMQPRLQSTNLEKARATANLTARREGPVRSDVPSEQTFVVGVVDFAHQFTELSKTIQQLNDAQSMFILQPVELTMPSGVWEVPENRRDRSGKNLYVHADRLAEALAPHVERLELDHLSCITNRWMMGLVQTKTKQKLSSEKIVHNLYGWWTNTSEQPISILSTAGFPIRPRGLETNRILANCLVTGLAGQMLEAKTQQWEEHFDRPECPFYINPDRDFANLCGHQKFDKQCHATLVKELGKQTVSAFDAMLNVFHK